MQSFQQGYASWVIFTELLESVPDGDVFVFAASLGNPSAAERAVEVASAADRGHYFRVALSIDLPADDYRLRLCVAGETEGEFTEIYNELTKIAA